MTMKRLLTVVVLAIGVRCYGQTAVLPIYACTLPGTQATVSGMKSTNYQQGIIPRCTVSVYLTGTTTLATTTPQSPFTANTNGSIPPIYAAINQGYDVVLSGGIAPNTYPAPVTITGLYAGFNGTGLFLPLAGGTMGNNAAIAFQGTGAAQTWVNIFSGAGIASNCTLVQNVSGTLTCSATTAAGARASLGAMPAANVSAFAQLQSAVTACGSTPCNIAVTGNIAVTSNYTIPSNVTLYSTGGQLQPATSMTLTVAGPIIAPPVQIFGGAGTVTGLSVVEPEWFGSGTTILTAANTLDQTRGGTIQLQNSTYIGGTSGFTPPPPCCISTPNVRIIGTLRPTYNDNYTQMVSGSGSIIQCGLGLTGNGLTIKNVGFDDGPYVRTNICTTVNITPLSIDPGDTNPPLTGLVLDNVNCLGYSNVSFDHCMLVENVDGASIHNIQTVYGGWGFVLKGSNNVVDGVWDRNHNIGAFYVGSTTGVPANNNSISHVVIDTSNGLAGTNGFYLNVTSTPLTNLNVSDVTVNNANVGLEFQRASGLGSTMQGIKFSNFTVNGRGGAFLCARTADQIAISDVDFSGLTCNNTGGFTQFPSGSTTANYIVDLKMTNAHFSNNTGDAIQAGPGQSFANINCDSTVTGYCLSGGPSVVSGITSHAAQGDFFGTFTQGAFPPNYIAPQASIATTVLASQIVPDNTFASCPGSWTFASGFTCSPGVGAVATAAPPGTEFYQGLTILNSTTYYVTATITGWSAGSVNISPGGNVNLTCSGNGFCSGFVTTPASGNLNEIYVSPATTFTGTISSVTLQPASQALTVGPGYSGTCAPTTTLTVANGIITGCS